MNDVILSIPQAAKHCGVSRWTIWKCVKAGTLKASVTPGGHHRILKEDLESFARDLGMYPFGNIGPGMKKVLIVDDDRDIQRMFKRVLSHEGYRVETASDGFEAGVKVSTFKPGVIVLDLVMPGMDGFEVCRRIRENPDTSRIKILAVTGYDDKENRDQIMKAGADDYLAKPVDGPTLIHHVEDLLKNRKSVTRHP